MLLIKDIIVIMIYIRILIMDEKVKMLFFDRKLFLVEFIDLLEIGGVLFIVGVI